MIKTLVSIVVPCYNDGIYLSECINSVIAQTYEFWECIIIDDGSTDNSIQVIESYTNVDKRIKYLSQINQGVSVARNNGIKIAEGEFILPLDADDRIHEKYVEYAIEIFKNDLRSKVVYCDCEYFGNRIGNMYLPDFSLNLLSCINLIFVSGIYRKVDFDLIGGYDENLKYGWEDWEFWIRMLKENGKVYKINQTLFYYRIKSISRNQELLTDSKKQSESKNYIYIKHFDFFKKYHYDSITAHENIHFLGERIIELENVIEHMRIAFYNSRRYYIGNKLVSIIDPLIKYFK